MQRKFLCLMAVLALGAPLATAVKAQDVVNIPENQSIVNRRINEQIMNRAILHQATHGRKHVVKSHGKKPVTHHTVRRHKAK